MAKKASKTYRQLFITFWEDEYIKKLTLEERYFYIYLLTNDRISFCGIYLLPLKLIQRQTGLSKLKLGNLLRKFQQDEKIYYSEETDEICLCNWLKYNCNINNANQMKGILSSLERVTDKTLIRHLQGIEVILPLDQPDFCQGLSEGSREDASLAACSEAGQVNKARSMKQEASSKAGANQVALAELPLLLEFAQQKIPDTFAAKKVVCQKEFLETLLLDYSLLTIYEAINLFVERQGYSLKLFSKLLADQPKRGSKQEEKPPVQKANPDCPRCKGKGVYADKKGFYECTCRENKSEEV